MDEVEHRRRRTRGRTATPGDSIEPRPPVPNRPAQPAATPTSPTPTSPTTTTVTPADIADRAGGERIGSDQHPAAHSDRPLPFEMHSAHPAHDDREGERGLRGLVGGGSTQVSVAAAMRARDAARPTEAELAEAAATLAIVHRGWVPRESS